MTNFNERIERLAELGALSKLICHNNGKDLAIATADGSNALGYFVPRHGYACEDMEKVIDAYSQALPLLHEMHGEIERLQNDYQTALRALALSRQQVYEMEDKLNA